MGTESYIAVLIACIASGILWYYVLKTEEIIALTIGGVMILTFIYIVTYKERKERSEEK